MGSSAGWKDVLSFGAYGNARRMARAQEYQANQYAKSQEQMAQAIEASNKVTPSAVQASTVDTTQAAEANANSAQKRKKTVASTQESTIGRTLGGQSQL